MTLTASKLTKSSSSSRMNPVTPSDRALNVTARSVPRFGASSSSSSSSSQSKDNFKRPKDPISDRSVDVQSLHLAKFLQIKLNSLKLDEELKKKSEDYSKTINEKWAINDKVADDVCTKRIALKKLTLYKSMMERLKKDNEWSDEVLCKLESMESDLDYLVDQVEARSSQAVIKGIEEQACPALNEIFKTISQIDQSQACKVALLAEKVGELRSLVGELDGVKSDAEQLTNESSLIMRQFESLQFIEKCIADGTY